MYLYHGWLTTMFEDDCSRIITSRTSLKTIAQEKFRMLLLPFEILSSWLLSMFIYVHVLFLNRTVKIYWAIKHYSIYIIRSEVASLMPCCEVLGLLILQLLRQVQRHLFQQTRNNGICGSKKKKVKIRITLLYIAPTATLKSRKRWRKGWKVK